MLAELADADGAYGTLNPELLAAAPRLRWLQVREGDKLLSLALPLPFCQRLMPLLVVLQCPAAAPVGSFFFPELVSRYWTRSAAL